jgi:hypothetical protein
MRKRIIPSTEQNKPLLVLEWLLLEQLAQVEVTSEEAEHPIESALLPSGGEGWRAGTSGAQILRLLFDIPQRLRHIRLHFTETAIERTQEFVLRASLDNGQSYQEIVRQQWSFNPQGATSEVEDYQVELSGVTALELAITPDISGGDARASLVELRLA